jgi:Zn-dependent protease
MSPIHVFTLGRIPVYLDPFYLILMLFWGLSLGLAGGIQWGLAVTLSLLVHEMGHALVARHYQLSPRVLLHAWGGLTMHERASRDRDDAYIIAAGPGAGLAFGVLVWVVFRAVVRVAPDFVAEHGFVVELARDLLYINVVWSLVNLLPLWPLDGGQLFRLLMLRLMRPAPGEAWTHRVGAGLGVVCFAFSVAYLDSPFFSIICGLLAFENFRRISRHAASGPIRPRGTPAEKFASEALEALSRGDHREAARLGHQARSESTVPAHTLEVIWTVLALAHAGLGEHQDALDYASRAPRTPEMIALQIDSLVATGQRDQARRVFDEEGRKLPAATREEFERAFYSV